MKSKRDFVKRYQRGEFGNAAPTWPTVEAFLKDYGTHQGRGLFHLRNSYPGGKTFYCKTYEEIVQTTLVGCYYVSSMAPSDQTLIQGEVRRTFNGLEFFCSTVKAPMRPALRSDGALLVGLKAKIALEANLNPVSYDWLLHLLDRYPDHIVELSAYSTLWGTLPGYNTVFWEVRPDRGFGSSLSQFTEVY